MDHNILYEYLTHNENKEFKLGTWDCLEFVASYHELFTEKVFIPQLRGKYKTGKGWVSKLRKIGYEDITDYLNDNFEIVNINYARRGDIVVTQNALGLCEGLLSVFLNENKGYNWFKTTGCNGAWRVNG